MENLLVSVSGGRSSGLMAIHISKSEKYKEYNKLYVFANTGEEKEETLVFIKQIEENFNIKIHWIEAVCPMKLGEGIEAIEVSFINASRKGEPFNAVIEKMNLGTFDGVPNQESPYCSYRLKKIPIDKFAKHYFKGQKYLTALGFRLEDMPKRISWSEIKEDKKRIFPLLTDFEYPISQKQVLEFWKNQDFDLQIDSRFGNCKLCWKKSESNLLKTLKKNPEYADFYRNQEKKYNKPFFRNYQFVDDLLKKANSMTQIDLFESQNEESCFCGI